MGKLANLFQNCAYTVKYKQAGDSVNYAFVEDKKTKTLEIYFQGSNSITDWVRNFMFPAVPYKDIDISFKVHRGFLAAWKEVEDIIINKVYEKELREPNEIEKEEGYELKNDYVWKHIIIVGYSHGAALSGLCHELVWYYRKDLRNFGLEGYGFESPRFYGSWFVKKQLKERWADYKVIRTNNDIVTHCPPWLFGFHHVGEMIKIKGDTTLVKNKQCKCIKSHYPEVVLKALIDANL